MSISTKLGYQLLGRPPESYRSKCGGSKGIKVVGDEADLTQLRDWHGKVEILQGRLITAEDAIVKAKERNDIKEIAQLAKDTAKLYSLANARLGVPGVWWEIPPIMPDVSPWTAKWYALAAVEFREMDLRSVPFGFATGTPQVAPWAGQGDHGSDEWPQLYDCLAVLHALGTDWVRIGVEEYITGGYLQSGDWSNVGRIAEVYNRHIKPNGWNIVFRGIEASYDLPGMWDAGVGPEQLLHGNKRGDDQLPDGGLAAADIRYSLLPYVDCMFLYAVCDPVTNINESSFAFTPGNKNTPIGYLERMQMYFAENPPKVFVAPKPGTNGSQLPPVEPPPVVTPPPTSVPEVVFSNRFDSFEPRRFADGDGHIMIPPGFEVGYSTGKNLGQLHGELYPSRETGAQPNSFRFHVMGRMKAWLRVVIPATPGATYRVTVVTDATVAGVNRLVGIDPAAGSSPFDASVKRFGTEAQIPSGLSVEAVATGPTIAAYWQVFADSPERSDAIINDFLIERLPAIVEVPPTPIPAGPGKAKTRKRTNGFLPNMRDAAAPTANLIYEGVPVGREVTLTGKVANGYSEIIGALVLDEDEPALQRMGWIPTDGLQRVTQ